MSLQKSFFHVFEDHIKLCPEFRAIPEKSAQVLKKEKLDFFRTKVFCEDLSSPYHYTRYHKNPHKHFPDEVAD